jgi:hypothetical protein
MNTTSHAVQLLEDAIGKAREARTVIDDLIVEHEYQDVATLLAQAGAALLQASTHLMRSDDEDALSELENAEELLDSVYAIIDGETDEDE